MTGDRPDPAPREVGDQAELAIRLVRDDVSSTLGADEVVLAFSAGADPEITIATTEVTPTVTGIWTYPGEPEEHLITRLANTVQDCIVESRRHFGASWPPCPRPGHRHPLEARSTSPGAWTCPSTQEVVAGIGHLDDP